VATFAAGQAGPAVGISAQGVFVYTRADPVPGGDALGEVRLVQPVVMLHGRALGGRLALVGTANFEGLTMSGGELTPGAWGEGFVDRRHPHTFVHELMLVAGTGASDARASLAAGKGFVPFGTDDPMVRPFVRYPVNHHLAQVLERAVMIGGVRAGPVAVEGALFNGDEPERPGQWPRVGGRFGDSRAVRATAFPAPGIELQLSHAMSHSPEHRPGAGTDQFKWSVSGRMERPIGTLDTYGLIEWGRTSEAGGFFVFETLLAEGSARRGRHRLSYRFEHTERPEEGRGATPFRSPRPHLENSILGVTRWTIHTAGYALDLGAGSERWMAQPFAEVSRGSIASVGGGIFDPASFYGRSGFWAVSVGLRLGWGGPMHRMGRYGVLNEGSAGHTH
jgi:hypothetical protein